MSEWIIVALSMVLVAITMYALRLAAWYRTRWQHAELLFAAELAARVAIRGDTRWCFKCNTHKSLDQFTAAPADSPTRDGYNYGCNSCTEGMPKWRRCPETRRMQLASDLA